MNEKILRFALISDVLAHQAWELNPPKAFEGDIPYVLDVLHEQNMKDLDLDHPLLNPRFATIAKVLGEEIGVDEAHDLLLILDEATQAIKNDVYGRRYANLKDATHSFYGKHFYPAYFLKDIYASSESLRGQLKNELDHDYIMKLAQIWSDNLDQQIVDLADSPNVVIWVNGQPNIPATPTLQRVSDLEKYAIHRSEILRQLPKQTSSEL